MPHFAAYHISLANVDVSALPLSALLDILIQNTNTEQTALANLRQAITDGVNINVPPIPWQLLS